MINAIMRWVIQVLAVVLLVLFGVGNILLYNRLVQSQQQNSAEMKIIDAEWARTTEASAKAQALTDKVADCERRIARLESEEDLIRGEENLIRGEEAGIRLEQSNLYENMSQLRTENERIRKIIYLDEKARIAQQNAEQVHDILKGDAAAPK